MRFVRELNSNGIPLFKPRGASLRATLGMQYSKILVHLRKGYIPTLQRARSFFSYSFEKMEEIEHV